MRKYAQLKAPLQVNENEYVYKVMLYTDENGVYLFKYCSPEAVISSYDVFYETLQELHEDWDELIDGRGWIDMEDPLPGLQHDAFIHLRVKGRDKGKPEWGRFETLKDGKWVLYSVCSKEKQSE